MESDAATPAKLAELRKQLESVSGQQIDVSDEQLLQLIVPVSLSSSEDGTVLLPGISFPSKHCYQVSPPSTSMLDVSSSASTDANGQRTFLLSNFICSTVNSFSAPVSLVVTPNAPTPCFATMTHTLVVDPSAPSTFSDLQIVVYTWNHHGQPAPNINFDWRCRLLSFGFIPLGR